MKTIHVCVSIKCALAIKVFLGFVHDDGSELSKREIKAYLQEQLKIGREVLPIGDPYDFSPCLKTEASRSFL